jgi:hypothetical protein
MFACEACRFACEKKGDWTRHLLTKKHLKTPKCACGRECPAVCAFDKNTLILKMLDENKELRSLLLEQQEQLKAQQRQLTELIPKIGNVTNNKFNLNVFLNEKCKDAVNWNDFIDTLKVQLEGDDSLTGGIAKVICDGIQDLGIHKRPIHCLDSKRRKLCIKTEDAWEQDAEKVQSTLQQSALNLQMRYLKELKEWETKHPAWFDNEREADIYLRLVQRVTGEIDESLYTGCISRTAAIPKDILAV